MNETGDVDVFIVRLGFDELYIGALLLRCSMMLHTIWRALYEVGGRAVVEQRQFCDSDGPELLKVLGQRWSWGRGSFRAQRVPKTGLGVELICQDQVAHSIASHG